ncbi:MAG: hypothetical protein J6U77_05030, partial [Verrucomicrobia bacterium]|nr:hypothetical protein [Verrucomicrobiota bacterium]
TLTVETSPDYKKDEKLWKNFCFFTANTKLLQTVKGDVFMVSAEIAGKGKLRYGFLGYGTPSVTKKIEATKDFQKISFEWTTKDVKGDASGKAYYRLFFEFSPGSSIQIRDVKLLKKKASGKDALRAGFRYYPVYKLSSPAADTLEKDLPNWANIPEGKGFLINKLDKFQDIDRQSSFKIAHRDGKLYVLIRCWEPYMDQVAADQDFWRDGRYLKNDSVEFCISSARGINLAHSYNLINSIGVSKRNISNKKIPCAILRGKDYWMIRLCFDLDDLLINHEKIEFNKDYYFNVGRTNLTADKKNIFSSISREFGQTNAFQVLELLDKISTEKEKREAEEVFNGRYESFLSTECTRIAKSDSSFWEKTYSTYGRLDESRLQDALKLSREAAKAKTAQEKEKIVSSFQKMDALLRDAQKEFSLIVSHPDKVKSLYLNGKKISVAQKTLLTLKQGLNTLCVETAPGEKVSLMVEKHPETLKAWRTSKTVPANWKELNFVDTKWPMAECDEKGNIISQGYVRQILVWENRHYGNWGPFTRTRKWNFVNNSLNTLKIQLDTPTPFPLDELVFALEVPSSFRTFQRDMSKKGSATSLRAMKVTKSAGSRKGFDRYEFLYQGKIKPIGQNPPAGSYIVFQADNSMKPGSEFEMVYFRSAGNLVELAQKMPCRILPPINGRIPKNIYIETWLYNHNLPSNYFTDVDIRELDMKDRLAAGINMQGEEKYYPLYGKTSANEVILTCYPIWGSGWSIKKHFYNYVKEHQEAQARFFGGTVKWGGKADPGSPRYKDYRETTQVCPTWATTTGKEDYIRMVAADIKEMRKKQPHAKIFFNNWEGWPSAEPLGYCFCDKCKEHFRKYASLPADLVLTDEVIKDRYWKKWYDFRVLLDGRTAGLVKKAANSQGMKYFLYHQYAYPEYWKAAAGNIDIPYHGCPGSSPADSRTQEIMDHVAKYMREYGYKFYMGQIFNPGWDWDFRVRSHSVNSHSGFFEPETTKAQIIRAVASNRGGISVWGSNFSGAFYYIGEATRALVTYEDIFTEGERNDALVKSKDIAYPNSLVIVRKNPAGKEERLVLLFNESEEAKTVEIENIALPKKYIAEIYEGKKGLKDANKLSLSIPSKDVLMLCIREK